MLGNGTIRRPGRATDRLICRAALQGVRAVLAGADPHDVLDRDGPHLAVADAAGLGALGDDVHHGGGVVVLDEDLDAHLGDHVHRVLRTAVDLGVPTLAAVAAGLGDRQAVDAVGLQGALDVLELERLDDRGDELHAFTSSLLRSAD